MSSKNRFVCLVVDDDVSINNPIITTTTEIDKYLQELYKCIYYVEIQCDYQLVLKYHYKLYKMLDKFKYMIKSLPEHRKTEYTYMISFIRKKIRYVLSYETHV